METLHILESRRRVQEEQMHRDVQIAFQLANAIGNRIGFLFKKPEDRSEEDLLQPWDVFPDLFKLDKIHAELVDTMTMCGARKLSDIDSSFVFRP